MRYRLGSWRRKINLWHLAAGGSLLLAIFGVYFWRLANLTPGMSPAEKAATTSSVSLHKLLLNPVNLPQRLLQHLIETAGYHSVLSLRLASVVFAIIFVGCFAWLVKHWFGLTIGIFSTLAFATTPLIVLLARSATSDIMLLSPIVPLAIYAWLSRREHRPDAPWLILAVACGLCLYSPGVLWFFGLGLFVLRKRLLVLSKIVNRRMLLISLGLFVVLILPLVWALFKNIAIYHQLLLLPQHWSSLTNSAKAIGWAALALVWRTAVHDPLIIKRLPLLDAAQVVFVIFGSYVMWTRAKRIMLVLLALIVGGIVLAGLNKELTPLLLALPALAILAGAGLRYLYIEWRGIFPKNPIPLSFALLVISLLIGLQVAYGLRYSLVAWPHTSATKQLYVLK